MAGFLVQWPTIPTLIMFPVLVVVYVRLAEPEEQEAIKEFGEQYRRYMESTSAWIPKYGQSIFSENN